GSSRVGVPRLMNCWHRSTAGSPRALTPLTCRRPRRCWRRSRETRSGQEGARVRCRRMMLRVTLALGLLVAPLAATTPAPGQMPRIGVLELGSPPASPDWKARSLFLQELRTLGWLEGQDLVLEYRWAEGQPSRLAALAAELVRLPVDVLVVSASPAIRAA